MRRDNTRSSKLKGRDVKKERNSTRDDTGCSRYPCLVNISMSKFKDPLPQP